MTIIYNKSIVSSNNTSTELLNNDVSFNGVGESVTRFETITVNIVSDVSGSISVQFGQSALNLDVKITDTYIASGSYSKTFRVHAPFFRIVYYNGNTTQTTFRLQCVFNTGDGNDNVIKLDSTNYDAFGRVRVSNPYTLFQVSHNTGLRHHVITSRTVDDGSYTWNRNESSVDMDVSTGNGSQVTRQARPYIIYQPGKSLLIMCTGVLNAGSNDVVSKSEIGLFDDYNGIYFSHKNGVFINLRSYVTGSVVNTSIPQSEWNLDVMDGTGRSGPKNY